MNITIIFFDEQRLRHNKTLWPNGWPYRVDTIKFLEQNENMNWEDDKDLLAFDIQFALGQNRYKPPKRFNIDDPDSAEKYHRDVARVIRDQLLKSWEFRRKSLTQFVPPSVK